MTTNDPPDWALRLRGKEPALRSTQALAFDSHHRKCLRCFYGTAKGAASVAAKDYKFDGCPRGKKLQRACLRGDALSAQVKETTP